MKILPGFSRYKVCENGDIYSFVCKRNRINGKKVIGSLSPNGYRRVYIRNDKGERVGMSRHRVVAMLYVPNPDQKPHVNHVDGNKLNNHYTNLE